MAKKAKHASAFPASLPDLKARTTKAVREGRFQAALELAKELHKRDPSAASLERVQTCYLGRARQLRGQGQLRDALTVLQAGLQFPGTRPPDWLGQIAEELAACGDVRQALRLLDETPGSSGRERVLARAADAALQTELIGRNLLPEPLHADFDRVLRAFALLEAGQDDAAREALQGIGLRSPFLEWKLLLRGLLAYSLKDDARALENWQRLTPERLPARLAAPYRFLLDPAFRVAQPPQAQATLQKQADRLQGTLIVQELRGIQAALAGDGSLYEVFRKAERLLPALRRDHPHLVGRLATCFYWAIINQGQPEDVARYQRVFGTPPDDPQFHRLRALALEHAGEMQEAHRSWQQFGDAVAGNAAWPPSQAPRVRALVWQHMGRNAANAFDPEMLKDLPPFLRDHPDRPRPLTPSAETCFQRSLELAPDLLGSHEALFQYHLRRDQAAKAEKDGKRLLDQFPEHAPTLEALADLGMHKGRYDEALGLFERAARANPLERRLRGKLSSAHLFRARAHAEAGRFDQARADYQASLAYRDGGETYPALCKWAACEFKAGDATRAEELLTRALAEAGTRLAIAFNMVIEAIRLKLPRPLKTRFDQEFNAALAEPPTAAGAIAVLTAIAAHRLAGVTYHGQKTHEKKVLAYVDRATAAEFDERQLERVCASLSDLKAVRHLRRFTELGRRRFPGNPLFPFLEADSWMLAGPQNCPVYRVQPLLDQARRLAEQLPRDPRQQELLAMIQEREQMVRSLNPLLDVFGGIFGGEADFDDGWDDDDYDDY